ncbi:MAG: hypothetical protein QGF20_03035 [Alphaproteobacteria bacterium]|nr:hypothetical protein [Alphaproteobacteria bacterium]
MVQGKTQNTINSDVLRILAVFGFLISGAVNDDAVKLKTFTDMALSKFGGLSAAEQSDAIEKEFNKEHCHVDLHEANFRFKELDDFLFSFSESFEPGKPRSLSVHGKGRYMGFMLQVINGGSWSCSVSDGIAYSATGGAKKLQQVMKKKFGVRNFDKLMKGMWF